MIAGVAAFGLLLAGPDGARGWRILLVNFVFWSGAAAAAVAWSAIFQVANARWPKLPRQMSAACAAYLPVAFVLFLATWLGRQVLFPRANHPTLYAREAAGLLFLYAVSLLYAYRTLRRDRGAPTAMAVYLLFIYVASQTIFAWDFLMWLEPEWTSTLFGAFYIVSSLYDGLAILTILTVWRSGEGSDAAVRHNLGKLLFSFSLLWVYFFWSQYLVIWYGNLPHEIGYVLARTRAPWSILAVMVLLMNFLVPFLLLLSRAGKSNRAVLLTASTISAGGLWLQQYLLAMPSLAPDVPPQFGAEALVTAGFVGLFTLTCLVGLRRIAGPS